MEWRARRAAQADGGGDTTTVVTATAVGARVVESGRVPTALTPRRRPRRGLNPAPGGTPRRRQTMWAPMRGCRKAAVGLAWCVVHVWQPTASRGFGVGDPQRVERVAFSNEITKEFL